VRVVDIRPPPFTNLFSFSSNAFLQFFFPAFRGYAHLGSHAPVWLKLSPVDCAHPTVFSLFSLRSSDSCRFYRAIESGLSKLPPFSLRVCLARLALTKYQFGCFFPFSLPHRTCCFMNVCKLATGALCFQGFTPEIPFHNPYQLTVLF